MHQVIQPDEPPGAEAIFVPPDGTAQGAREAGEVRLGTVGRGLSISRKILLVVVAATFVALLVAAAALLHLESGNYYKNELSVQTALADVVGKASSTALIFDDLTVAQKNLNLLREHGSVVSAALYRQDGSLFAAFARDARGRTQVPLTAAEAHRDSSTEYLEVFRPIMGGSEAVGSIYIRARYGLYDRLWNYGLVLAAIMLLSLLVAGLLSLWLQRIVTAPILRLTRAAREVVAERNFSVRVPRSSDDEVGQLVDAFNSMLQEVGLRTAALERSEAMLRTADQRKDEFLATLAHELRNPLAPLRNGLDLLKLKSADPALLDRMVPLMERQVNQMARLVNDLLDVARMTTGKLALELQVVDLARVVTDAIETVQPLITARAQDFRVSLPAESVFVRADAVRLAQILSNLLNNAFKYTPVGRPVSLVVERHERRIEVTVKDAGIGIRRDMLDRIFDMFTQAGPPSTGKRAGLGVGLALTKQLVELHGGSIVAKSDGEDRGSEFVIRLPLETKGADAATERARGPSPAAKSRAILVADDNRDHADTLADLLKLEGHVVRVAYDGRSALAAAKSVQPQFAFLDIGLPDMDGYELARRLRQVPGLAHCTLIAVTGFGQAHDRERALRAGFDDHLVKPASIDSVLDLLASPAT